MKHIAIFTDHDSELAAVMKDNLEVVFKDQIAIVNYYFDHMSPNVQVNADVVLVMINERVLPVKAYVSDVKKISVLKRTLYEREIYKLFTIPAGTEVLVVNDTPETTMDTISMLYQLGIDHLRFVPLENFKSGIHIAITPGESRLVPNDITEIIDLGHRCIDVSTFIEIISKLQIDDKSIHKRLIQYSESILSLDNGIKNAYRELYVKNEELEMIFNLSEEGLLMIDLSGRIQRYNQAFGKMFCIDQTHQGAHIDEVFEAEVIGILSQETLMNQVIKYKDKYLSVTKNFLVHFEKNIGLYFNFQEITYIKKLEQNLSRQLKDQGQIARYTFEDLLTHSDNMSRSIDLGKKLAGSDLSVLITGESGTGKELMAQSIHNASSRNSQPFVAVNCAAMPENLLESELFGYEPGAFTGALKEGKRGLFEQAHNGTIFLDEIGDMPVLLQTKLLRVLQEQQVMRIGSQRIINIDVRVIAATHKNLVFEIGQNRFRQDLYYRLNVLPLHIPPLRNRKEDIIPLITHFMDKALDLSESVENALLNYPWPGNIREVKNVSAYISLMCNAQVTISDLPHDLQDYASDMGTLFKNIEVLNETPLLIETLKILSEMTKTHQGCGRLQIVKRLEGAQIYVSEGEIRGLLNKLCDLGLAESHIGRKGCTLTELGSQLLNRLINR